MRIPFNQAYRSPLQERYLEQALSSGRLSGDGAFTKKCHQLLEQKLGVSKALLTTSCTHALEMAALLLEIRPGDEVIAPSFTFVSTVNAFVLRGARAIFADIRPDTLNIDESLIEGLITDKTRAIVVVHYAGVACEMDAIMEIANRRGIPVIEDNAHGLFGTYKGQPLGSIGSIAALSFHETKNFSCGEGGALLINDMRYAKRAEILREKGTDRSRFFRGEVDKYTWVDLGSSYLPSDVLAAILLSQLEIKEEIQSRRATIWNHYHESLGKLEESTIRLPEVPKNREQAFHMYYVLAKDLNERQRLISHLKQAGICSVFHYLPLHLSQMGRAMGGQPGDCPVTEAISDRLTRLPFYTGMSVTDQDDVIDTIQEYFGRKGKSALFDRGEFRSL